MNLSAYAGSAIQLRFNRITGGTWQADIAIDNIDLSDPAPPTCDDGEQNGDEEGVDCGGSFCAPCTTTSVILSQGFFETGWDGWSDGGGDCARVNSSNSYEGIYSIRLRDNSGTSSAMTLSNVNLTSYDQVEVEFFFYPNSMENGEDFWLRFFNGSTWTTVATYISGSSFTNGSFFTATVTLDATQYNFATNSGFRFQCDASSNQDQIYIDQVTRTGISGSVAKSKDGITALGGGSSQTIESLEEGDFTIYPNPVSGKVLHVKLMNSEGVKYRLVDMLGQTIRQGELSNDQVDVSNLRSGVYFIELDDGDEVMMKRFIRQ
ncbi:MAG: T9SS type A sorting domain-containing protein [Flavobacteriaceae bacterium]|nr:T9SS type A sorting domain-containing protein [Flavobacteriaceae bacterium]